MSRKILIPLASFAFLAACVDQAAAPADLVGTPFSLTSSQAASVTRAVRDQMRDPASAEVSNLTATANSDGNVTVCGLVNGKNLYGAYTGRLPFAGMLTPDKRDFLLVGMADNEDQADAMISACRKRGVILR